MNADTPPLAHVSLQQLFAAARAVVSVEDVTSLTMSFHQVGVETDHGTLNVIRNPASLRWLTTLELTLGKRYYEHYAHGDSSCAALDEIEEHVCRWLLYQTGQPCVN